MKNSDEFDCIIIGGGPAGLTAGIYLARFRRSAVIFDNLDSRASRIPLSHNYPCFPSGISGKDLLKKFHEQLSSYPIPIINKKVETLKKDEQGFLIEVEENLYRTNNIILATGVKDNEPELPNLLDGVFKGLIRHCAVCDAFEVINRKLAVIGEGDQGLNEALFLRNYTPNVTLITSEKSNLWSKKQLKLISDANIKITDLKIEAIELTKSKAEIVFVDGKTEHYDSLYSALGCIKNNKLAIDVDAKLSKGLIVVNKKQETSVPGLYAAGDIVSGLNQICVAESQAAIAATAIHDKLNKTKGYTLI
ncbi:MAG: NAD(P)/FAD-dependent oxidoreductase [Tatlockia sp.]|nr:NAD(P)/FAD-dependent oxidoreductase [Tatlockia sp.]